MLKYLYKRNSADLIIHEVYMTRKRSKLNRVKTRSKHGIRTMPVRRKTQRGGAGRRRIIVGPKFSNVFEQSRKFMNNPTIRSAMVASSVITRRLNQEQLLTETLGELSDEVLPIDNSFDNNYTVDELSAKLARLSIGTVKCTPITDTTISNSIKNIKNVEKHFKEKLRPIFIGVVGEMLKNDFIQQDINRAELYKLYYQRMNDSDLQKILRALSSDLNADAENTHFVSEDAIDETLFKKLHSGLFKMLAGYGTRLEMEKVIKGYKNENVQTLQSTPSIIKGGSVTRPIRTSVTRPIRRPVIRPVYSDLRNLCMAMRDILGLTNHFLREIWRVPGTEWHIPLEIGDSQFCHSGGNIIYLICRFIDYLLKNKGMPYDPNDILEQIRFMFDTSLGNQKDTFYLFLETLAENPEFSRLIFCNTISVSDLDFSFFTGNKDILRDENRNKVKDMTLILGGEILGQCCKGFTQTPAQQTSNIALQVVFPTKTFYDPVAWPAFVIRRNNTGNNTEILKAVDARIRTPSFSDPLNSAQLHGVKLNANNIEELVNILLVRVKVGPNGPNLSLPEELKGIYAEKLDFVIGSMKSVFYSHKQEQFSICNYYSLMVFLIELLTMALKSGDDKSAKRMDRFSILLIFFLVESIACEGTDPEVIIDAVLKAVEKLKEHIIFDSEERAKEESESVRAAAAPIAAREAADAAKVVAKAVDDAAKAVEDAASAALRTTKPPKNVKETAASRNAARNAVRSARKSVRSARSSAEVADMFAAPDAQRANGVVPDINIHRAIKNARDAAREAIQEGRNAFQEGRNALRAVGILNDKGKPVKQSKSASSTEASTSDLFFDSSEKFLTESRNFSLYEQRARVTSSDTERRATIAGYLKTSSDSNLLALKRDYMAEQPEDTKEIKKDRVGKEMKQAVEKVRSLLFKNDAEQMSGVPYDIQSHHEIDQAFKTVFEKTTEYAMLCAYGEIKDCPKKCWFNLLFGIIFKFLDPSAGNVQAEGCQEPCGGGGGGGGGLGGREDNRDRLRTPMDKLTKVELDHAVLTSISIPIPEGFEANLSNARRGIREAIEHRQPNPVRGVPVVVPTPMVASGPWVAPAGVGSFGTRGFNGLTTKNGPVAPVSIFSRGISTMPFQPRGKGITRPTGTSSLLPRGLNSHSSSSSNSESSSGSNNDWP